MAKKDLFGGVELGRFAFALGVLIYHYWYYLPLADYVPGHVGPSFLIFGRFGVEAFFVISGFVITYTISSRSSLQFAYARFVRLYPALLICSTITFTLVAIFYGVSPFLERWLKSLTFVPMLLGGKQVDPSYWSIVIELRFYLLIAVVMLFTRRIDHFLYIGIAWALLSVLAFVVPSIQIFVLAPYSAFFIFGIMLRAWHGDEKRRLVLLMLPFVLALAALQVRQDFARIDLMDGSKSPWWTGAAVAMVIFGITALMCRRLPTWANPIARTLGSVSYPLYLLHQYVGVVIINELTPSIGFVGAALVTTVVVLLASLVICLYCEPPLQNMLRRLPKRVSAMRSVPKRA